MKCLKCGNENNDDSKFCNQCGENLTEQEDKLKNKEDYEDSREIIETDVFQLKEKVNNDKEDKTIDKNSSIKLSNIFKNKILIVTILFILVSIGIFIYILIDVSKPKTPDEVFKLFPNNKDLALKQYDKLDEDGKYEVEDMIKKNVASISISTDDENVFEKDIAKYRDIKELDSYFDKMISNRKSLKESQEKVSQKIIDDFNKIVNNENSIGINNMNKNQLVDFINQYMKYLDNNNTTNCYDSAIGNLVQLKQAYTRKTNYKTAIWGDILVRQPKIGMSKNEVIALTEYIQADNINKTTTTYGIHEQYVYGNNYLYFDDGKLTSIQN